MSDVFEPLYRVVEAIPVDEHCLEVNMEPKITAGMPWRNNEQISYNRKNRIYPRYQEAKVYRDKLVKQGRDARILEFVFRDEVQ